MSSSFPTEPGALPPGGAAELPDSQYHLQALFHNHRHAVAHCRVLRDAQGRAVDYVVERVNAACERVLQRRREDVQGRCLSALFPHAAGDAFDYPGTFGRIAQHGGEGYFDVHDPRRDQWLRLFAYSHRRGWFTLVFSDITAQRRTELALQESEEHLRAAFEQAAVGMAYLTLDGRWSRLNRRYCEMLGYAEAELLGRSFLEVTHPDDQARCARESARLQAGLVDTVRVEKRYRHRDGHSVWARLTLSVVHDAQGRPKHRFVVAEDITARRQAQAELEGFFRQAAVGMAVVDAEGRVRRANQRLADLLGYTVEALQGVSFRAATHPDDLASTLAQFRRLLAGEIGEYTLEKRYRRRDGRYVWCLVSVSLVQESGAQPFIVAVIKDIEARKRLEAELEEVRQQLERRVAARTAELQLAKQQAEEALRAAEAASAAKTEFLAIMSHEIRTPLNGVIGFNGLLLDGPLSEEKRPYAELARQSGEALLHLLNDFLDFSKIESGHLELEPTDFELEQEVQLVLSLVQEAAQRKGLALQWRLLAPGALRGDAARLRQVLLNLLSNAVKFTEQGSVTLECEEIMREAPRVWLCFRVTDTGIGIPPTVRARLFQPFVQADASTTRRYGGTGLGLAICKRLVEAMGGKIGIHSQPGQGATFWFQLPFMLRGEASFAPPPVPAPMPGCRGRVLVVEDNPVSQLLASTMLKRLGCRVDAVGNGQEAVEAVRRLPYDLILMDCDMPVLNGLDATRVIRAEEGGRRHVPIIAITASALAGDAERCREAGMDDFLAKPVRQQELAQKVLAWLRPGA